MGECRFVVKVLEHDWLEHESLYMEYCSQNLNDYIRQSSASLVRSEDKAPTFKAVAKIPENMGPQLQFVQPNTPLDRPRAVVHSVPLAPVDQAATQMPGAIPWEPIGTIIENIVSGLNYIHGKTVVHRGLKPENGTVPWSLLFLILI
jgi:serine/threonine protein kinase